MAENPDPNDRFTKEEIFWCIVIFGLYPLAVITGIIVILLLIFGVISLPDKSCFIT